MPCGLFGLSLMGHRSDSIYQGFLTIFTSRLGADPIYCTLLAAAGFYAYAAIRRASWSIEALTATLVLLAIVPTHFLQDRTFTTQPAPLVAAATLLLGLGIWNRQSWRCLAGALGLVAGLALAFPSDAGASAYRWPIMFHLAVVILFLVGTAFEDVLARVLRVTAGVLVLLAAMRVLLLPLTPPTGVPLLLIEAYPVAVACLLALYGVWRWHVPSLAIAATIFALWSLVSGWQIYRVCRQLVVGLDYLVLSMVVFMLAIGVSLAKAGVLRRWWTAWRDASTADTA
jgi:hypothetical protein